MTMLELDRKKRRETLKVILKPETAIQRESHTSVYPLRTYTLKQLINLLDRTGAFEIVAVFDEYYDVKRPIKLNAKSDYAVLVLKKII